MGHIKRSLLLADKLSHTYKIVFIMKKYSDGVKFVTQKGFEVETIDIDDNNDASLIKFSDKYSPAKVIFDLYSNPYTTFFDYARKKQIQTIVFDILGKCCGSPDILINDSFIKEFTNYSQLSDKTKMYLGPSYFIMDNPPSIIPLKDSVRNVMITMGGSDPAGLTVKILKVMMNTVNYHTHVVLGPAFTEHKSIYNIAKNREFIKIYENPLNFLELLSSQDVVISAAGRTLCECAYLGRPVIVVPSIEHEAKISLEYARLTGSFDIGLWNEEVSPNKVISALNKYANSYTLREYVFNYSMGLIDGLALERIMTLLGT